MFLLNSFSSLHHVERQSSPTPNILNKAIQTHSPIIFTDVMGKWNCNALWSFDYFEREYGEHMIASDRYSDGFYSYRYQTIREYLDYARNTKDLNPFYAKTTLHLSAEFANSYVPPKCFDCWYNKLENRKVELSSLYIGPQGSKCNLHIDIWGTSFWNALFEGRKLWVFYRELKDVGIFNANIDPFTENYADNDYLKNEVPIVCIQKPGELIYCPGNMWHAVYNIEPSLVLSENFINESDYENVLSYFEKTNQIKAFKKMKDLADFHLKKELLEN